MMSRFGTVIGVTNLRTNDASSSSKYRAGTVEEVLPGSKPEPEKRDWRYWTLVTFLEPEAAQRASSEPIVTTVENGTWKVAHVMRLPHKTYTLEPRLVRFQERKATLSKIENRGYAIHSTSVLASRGSVTYPYVYSGKRDAYRESSRGAKLNGNHSHYILVDDDTDNGMKGRAYGAEIHIRDELLDFISCRRDIDMVQDDVETDLETLTQAIRDGSNQRIVPTICFVFGGGAGTITTVLEHVAGESPVIVVLGSGRAADLISDWCQIHAEMAESQLNDHEPYNARERLNSLARTWLLKNNQAKMPTTAQMVQQLESKVENFRKDMDTIATFSQLRFYDVQGLEQTELCGNLPQAPSELLPVVLSSIFESPTITRAAKLPLAVRYDDVNCIQRIMSTQGLTMLEDERELTVDTRPLIIAAFNDQASVFKCLEEWGGDVDSIDNLILLELHQLAQLRALDNILRARSKSKKTLSPPLSWIKHERRFKKFPTSEQHQHNEWLSLSIKAQVEKLKVDWGNLSLEKQSKIISDDIETVSWDKLPWVTGWTYMSVYIFNKVKEGDETDKTVQGHIEVLGQIFTVTKVERSSHGEGSGDIVVELVSNLSKLSTKTHRGKVVTSQEAESQFEQHSGQKAPEDVFMLGSHQWIIISVSGCEVLLQQNMNDPMVNTLNIKRPGQWCPRHNTRHMSKTLTKQAFEAFAPWVHLDDVQLGLPWWQTRNDSGVYHQRLYPLQLEPLHRLFWAVMTERDTLAEYLWRQMSPHGMFAGAFICGHAIRNAQMANEVIREARATGWDSKTTSLLDEISSAMDPGCTRAILDEYVYFGEDEEQYADSHPHEMTKYGALSTSAKQKNTKRRFALILMGCNVHSPMTRVDLAVLAQSKPFLEHPLTAKFMDLLWISTTINGGKYFEVFVGRILSGVSPRMKFRSNTFGWGIFLLLYAYVYLDGSTTDDDGRDIGGNGFRVPTKMAAPSGWEYGFWCWVFILMGNEVSQIYSDFDSLGAYLLASGNWVDAVIQTIFLASALCRFVSGLLILYFETNDIEALTRCHSSQPACEVYMVGLALLGLNFIACGARVLYNLSIIKEIGILLIVTMPRHYFHTRQHYLDG
jgi:hypothetical protein